MWPSTSGASRLCAETATFEPKLYAQIHNPTHRFGVSCSGSAADCEKSHQNTAEWVCVELVWEGKRNFDELIKTL